MSSNRRGFTLERSGVSVAVVTDGAAAEPRSTTMFGLISEVTTTPGHRDELVGILTLATQGMPGCLSYVIALDATRDDAVWITEVWRDKESHAVSLQLPDIQAAMTKGRPLIAGMGSRTETRPVAGV